jgi:hypothetical protein
VFGPPRSADISNEEQCRSSGTIFFHFFCYKNLGGGDGKIILEKFLLFFIK